MKNFKVTLLTMFLFAAGLINAKQTASKSVSQQPVENQSLFGTNQASSEDFWKIFGEGLNEYLQESTKKIPYDNAMEIVNRMNYTSDTFNQDYSFTELNPSFIMSKLTAFLENSKNQISLKKFLQILKDNIAGFPQHFSTMAVNLENSINNKNAKQFYAVFSTLERYFKGLGIRPLIRITQPGWLASIKNAIMNRARRTYNYLFGSKSEDEGFSMISKYIITTQDSEGKPVTKMITETQDPTGKTMIREEVKK